MQGNTRVGEVDGVGHLGVAILPADFILDSTDDLERTSRRVLVVPLVVVRVESFAASTGLNGP